MQAVNDGLDESQSQARVAHIMLDALLEHKVAELTVDNLVQTFAVDKLLNDPLLKIIVSFLNCALNQV